MPNAEPSGFIPTLNNMGYMTSRPDPVSQAFIEFAASQAPTPALDVGAAYGVASLTALERGATIIANDIDPRHLEVLSARAMKSDRPRLSLRLGPFPQGFEDLEGSLSAILVCRVIHFLKGQEVERWLKSAHNLLTPGGKIFVVTETPYLKNFCSIIPQFEDRKRQGDNWPGWIEDLRKIDPRRGANLPASIHFFDPDLLSRELSKAGFSIESCTFLHRADFPEDLRLDGRESVGAIGVKR
ncbi:MAG: class I SAM-dependent methyltransferase [Deltaproteobacteria bacterium]|nr:class I SAM-dependent methyltransferase [Deltaproteobacteria bacterium]MBI3294940.1 class I SAM-dependent methyltransferase [Deltaproteobacteria bacterium]